MRRKITSSCAKKYIIHQPFSIFRPVFDEVSKELGVEDKNPFGEEEEDDEYDSSGKNPFAE